MSEIEEADAYLGARNYTDWTDLELEEKVGLLLQAADYITATYTFTVDEPETRQEFKAAKCYLALQISRSPLSLQHADPVSSREERLEGVVTEKTSYAVARNSDPYPLVTKLLRPITAQTGGFQIVEVTK